MDAVDNFIPEPVREIDKPFLMPVEDVFTISGRGTVVTDEWSEGGEGGGRGGDCRDSTDTEDGVYGRGDVSEDLGSGQAGDNIGVLLRGTKREEVERGQVVSKPGRSRRTRNLSGGVYLDEEEGVVTRRFSMGIGRSFTFGRRT